ncbi:thiamine phosphate synthase [Prosthecochloris sp. SCSIO W1101]|uniref:thiamine phosphate synthase n=1 Tax=Prosthecochloris sp. SCSIO W1101 TaxID=2992242 RepID=UPI00223D2237|nr:thiamine phosphate synthase [Prosthecochloris sp. SCSIO W1101]UZJ42751.1 thiamine phosphate synthase [Prosthecochloris sp. SCSIO W1101]
MTATNSSCPVKQSEKALEGGAHMIQLRNKTASGSALYDWAVDIQKLCRIYGAIFIVNDRVDIALPSMPTVFILASKIFQPPARKLLGKNKILGMSISSSQKLKKQSGLDVNYVGLGHIYPTSSKQKTGRPLGISCITEVSRHLSIPVIAIGGITASNAGEVVRAGASGIAVISAVAEAPDPRKATSELIQNMQSCLQ